jgi:thiol:disulfide interchange protein
MKRSLITISIIVVAGVFLVSQMNRLLVDTSLPTWLDNSAGFQQALLSQAESGKPIAIFFYTDWCASCKQLKANVLGTTEITDYIQQNFIAVKINPEHGPNEQRIAQQFGVYGYPSFFIKNPGEAATQRIQVGAQTKSNQFVSNCNNAAHMSKSDSLPVVL